MPVRVAVHSIELYVIFCIAYVKLQYAFFDAYMKPRYFFVIVFILALASASCDRYKPHYVQTTTVLVDSLDQIILVSDSMVKPILYNKVLGLEYLPTPHAKKIFISAILPAVLIARHNIDERKAKVLYLKEKEVWENEDSAFYQNLALRYKAKNIDDLCTRMITLPNSIVLAQAAVESGWGQSRFFLEGSNLFGVWSFDKHEPRIAASKTRSNKYIYLRAYKDMSESIVHYFEILGRAKPYSPLRKARAKTDDPFVLLKHLTKYSERGSAYTRQLRKMIKINNLTKFDHYEIDPEYIRED
jgi:Bax protein